MSWTRVTKSISVKVRVSRSNICVERGVEVQSQAQGENNRTRSGGFTRSVGVLIGGGCAFEDGGSADI